MPKLIKGNAVIEDSWTRIADTDATPDSGCYLIPLEKWLGLTEIDHKNASLAPWIGADDDIEDCLPSLLDAQLIAIDFPTFMDGRGFSTAEILRHAGFIGELRAVGNLIQDQLFFLKRSAGLAQVPPRCIRLPQMCLGWFVKNCVSQEVRAWSARFRSVRQIDPLNLSRS